MVAFVVIAFVVVITISNRRSFFAWVSDNPGFNDWLRKNGHSVPLNFKKLGYAESQRKYEEYLAFQKQENDVQIASERGLLSGVSTPSFLALSRREIAFRILLAGFFLFPFVATYAFSVFGIFDNQEQSNIIMMGMFGFLPVLVLTGIDLRGITDSSSKIRHFRNLVRSPRFLKWCQKRGYSVNANTERGIFSEWAEEFDAVWEKENREFEMWLKDRKYDLES
ncbi:MAG: hypothetical protein QG650_1028 [Patescibacteria group bacterium]|nr:hypothetical protein [Patescibacteria group bacterium]